MFFLGGKEWLTHQRLHTFNFHQLNSVSVAINALAVFNDRIPDTEFLYRLYDVCRLFPADVSAQNSS